MLCLLSKIYLETVFTNCIPCRLHVQRYRELFDRKLNQCIAVWHYIVDILAVALRKEIQVYLLLKTVGNFKIIQFTRTKIMS